jgi:hypothetical protein
MSRFLLPATAAIFSSLILATPAFVRAASPVSSACSPSSHRSGAAAAGLGAGGVAAPAPSARPLPPGCETATRPWSAPVGHRQPQAVDVPSPSSPSEQTVDQEDANVDRIIKGICRGC